MFGVHAAFLLPCLLVLTTSAHAEILVKIVAGTFVLFVLTESFDARAALAVLALSSVAALWTVLAPLAKGSFFSGILDPHSLASAMITCTSVVAITMNLAAASAHMMTRPSSRLSTVVRRGAPVVTLSAGTSAAAAAARALLPPVLVPWAVAISYGLAAISVAHGALRPITVNVRRGLISDRALGMVPGATGSGSGAGVSPAEEPVTGRGARLAILSQLASACLLPALLNVDAATVHPAAAGVAGVAVAAAAAAAIATTPVWGARLSRPAGARVALACLLGGAVVSGVAGALSAQPTELSAELAAAAATTATPATPLSVAATSGVLVFAAVVGFALALPATSGASAPRLSIDEQSSAGRAGRQMLSPSTAALLGALVSGSIALVALRLPAVFTASAGIMLGAIIVAGGASAYTARAPLAFAAAAAAALTTRDMPTWASAGLVIAVGALGALAATGALAAASFSFDSRRPEPRPLLKLTHQGAMLLLMAGFVLIQAPPTYAWVDRSQAVSAATIAAALAHAGTRRLSVAGAAPPATALAVLVLVWIGPLLALVASTGLRIALAAAAAVITVVAAAAGSAAASAQTSASAGRITRFIGAPAAALVLGALAGLAAALSHGASVSIPAIVTATAFPAFAADEVLAVLAADAVPKGLSRILSAGTGLVVGGALTLAARAAALWVAAAAATAPECVSPTGSITPGPSVHVGEAPSQSVAPESDSEEDGVLSFSVRHSTAAAAAAAAAASAAGGVFDEFDTLSESELSDTPATPAPARRPRRRTTPPPTSATGTITPGAAATRLRERAVQGSLVVHIGAAAVAAGLLLLLLNTPGGSDSDLDPLIARRGALAADKAAEAGVRAAHAGAAGSVMAACSIMGLPFVVAVAGRGRERIWPIALYATVTGLASVLRALIGAGLGLGAALAVLAGTIGLGLVVALRQPGAAVILTAGVGILALVLGRPDVHAHSVLVTLGLGLYAIGVTLRHDAYRARRASSQLLAAHSHAADGTQVLMTFLGLAVAASSAGFSAASILPLACILLLGPAGSWNLVAVVSPLSIYARAVVETCVGYHTIYSTIRIARERGGSPADLSNITRAVIGDTLICLCGSIAVMALLLGRPGTKFFRWTLRLSAILPVFGANPTIGWYALALLLASFVGGADVSTVEQRRRERAAEESLARIHAATPGLDVPSMRRGSRVSQLAAPVAFAAAPARMSMVMSNGGADAPAAPATSGLARYSKRVD